MTSQPHEIENRIQSALEFELDALSPQVLETFRGPYQDGEPLRHFTPEDRAKLAKAIGNMRGEGSQETGVRRAAPGAI